MSDTTSSVLQTIAVTSDTPSLLRALRATFTRTQVALPELLQNARRASATLVTITLDGDTLIVEDNGIGIEDFQMLVAMAKSGWDETVQKNDAPYGLGFLSALFACEHITVTSREGRFSASTDDLLQLAQITVERVERQHRTRIELKGHKLGNEYELKNLLHSVSRGFPLNVVFNGSEMTRPHANYHDMVRTRIGWVEARVLEGEGVGSVYLQGLPVRTEHLGRRYGNGRVVSGGGVLHLDPTLFHGRMPDRDSLLEPEASAKRIVEGLDEAARQHMTERADLYRDHHFIQKFGTWCRELDMRDLLNRMDYIPGKWVGFYESTPRLGGNGSNDGRATPAGVVSRQSLEEKGLFLVGTEGPDWQEDLLAAHVVESLGGFYTDGDLPEWHWAHALIREISPSDFMVQPSTEIGRENVEIYGASITLVLSETLDIISLNAVPGIPATVAGSVWYDASEGVLFATTEADAYDAVWQVSDFQDEENFEEDREEEAVRNFNAARAVLRDRDPAALLTTFLVAGLPWKRPKALHGHRFTVAFDEDGKVLIEQEQAKAA